VSSDNPTNHYSWCRLSGPLNARLPLTRWVVCIVLARFTFDKLEKLRFWIRKTNGSAVCVEY
jgi:hypothetical protein